MTIASSLLGIKFWPLPPQELHLPEPQSRLRQISLVVRQWEGTLMAEIQKLARPEFILARKRAGRCSTRLPSSASTAQMLSGRN